jgi:hypothetical protein
VIAGLRADGPSGIDLADAVESAARAQAGTAE